MNIQFQDYELSKKIFRKAYDHPEKFGDKLPCRKLTEDFWFIIDGREFVIRKGFWWDGASIPRVLWSVIGSPWEEDIAPGALIHDVLYGSQFFTKRHYVDNILFEVNKINGMSNMKNYAVLSGVRSFGWAAWNAKTDEQIEGVSKHLIVDEK